jgi:SAM-dependent methyltransferase
VKEYWERHLVNPEAEKATEQRKQLQSYLRWVVEEGGVEGPVRLDTFMRPEQIERVGWLAKNSAGQILEVGCTWGFVLAAVGGHAGVDINPANVRLARILAPDRTFLEMNALDLSYFHSDSFDTIILAEVLEHLPFDKIPVAVAEARRLLRPGGRILVTIPVDEHAHSFKHQWFLNNENRAEFMAFFGPPEGEMSFVNVNGNKHFLCLKVEHP